MPRELSLGQDDDSDQNDTHRCGGLISPGFGPDPIGGIQGIRRTSGFLRPAQFV
jgi:hypothetical protein